MADTNSIRRLHESFNTLTVGIAKRADALTARVNALGVRAHKAMDVNEALLNETEQSLREMEDTHNQSTNGAPPLEPSPSPSGPRTNVPPGVTLNPDYKQDPNRTHDDNGVWVNKS